MEEDLNQQPIQGEQAPEQQYHEPDNKKLSINIIIAIVVIAIALIAGSIFAYLKLYENSGVGIQGGKNITLLSPNDDKEYCTSEPITIKWKTIDSADLVKIRLLTADGSQAVESLRADKGEYVWEKGVSKADDVYRFRVDLDGFGPEGSDISDNFLTFVDCNSDAVLPEVDDEALNELNELKILTKEKLLIELQNAQLKDETISPYYYKVLGTYNGHTVGIATTCLAEVCRLYYYIKYEDTSEEECIELNESPLIGYDFSGERIYEGCEVNLW